MAETLWPQTDEGMKSFMRFTDALNRLWSRTDTGAKEKEESPEDAWFDQAAHDDEAAGVS